jgi:hypothetical protein
MVYVWIFVRREMFLLVLNRKCYDDGSEWVLNLLLLLLVKFIVEISLNLPLPCGLL